MSFRFSLEAVLRYRQSLEDAALRHLQMLILQRAQLNQEVRQIQLARRQSREAVWEAMQQSPHSGAELQLVELANQSLASSVDQVQKRLAGLEKTIAQQTGHYQTERQKREMLSSLRERRLRDYQSELQHREQHRLDELRLLKRI